MAGNSTLQIVITALNQSTAALAQVQNDLKATGAAVDVAAVSHNKLQGVLSGVGNGLSSLGGTIKNLEQQWIGLGTAIAGAAGAFTAVSFVKGAITETEALGESVRQLQLITGATAPKASELIYAFNAMGISADTADTMLTRFTKNMFAFQVANEDGSAPVKTTAQLLHDMGIAATDATGAMKPTTDLLAEVADRFQAMHNPALESATAVALFGRSGTEMLPFLDLGSKGMADMAAEADKLGVTLTQSNVDAIHKSVLAHREFDAALEGVKLHIGNALLPVLTSLSLWFVAHQQDIIDFAGAMRDQLVAAFDKVQAVIAPLLSAFEPFVRFLQDNPKDAQAMALALGLVAAALVGVAVAVAVVSLVSSPFTVWIVGIAAVTVAIVELQRHWDSVWAAMKAAPQALLDWFTGGGWKDVLGTVLLGPLYLVVAHWDDIFSHMPEPVQNAMNAVAAVVAGAINKIVDVVDTIIGIANKLAEPFLVAAAVIAGVVAVMFLPVTLAIAAIIAAAVLLYQNWDTVWNAMVKVVSVVMDAVMAVINFSIGLYKDIWSGITAAWSAVWDNIGGPVKTAMDFVGGIIESAINHIIDLFSGLLGVISDAYGAISGLLGKIGISIGNIPTLPHVSFQLSAGGGGGNGRGTAPFYTWGTGVGQPPTGAQNTNPFNPNPSGGSGGSGGLTAAEKLAQQNLIALALAFAAFNKATGGTVQDFDALLKVSQDKADLDKRMVEAGLALNVAQKEAADSGFQLQSALVSIAEYMVKTGETITEVFRDIAQKAVDALQGAANSLFNRPTVEGAQAQAAIDQLQLQRDQLALRRGNEAQIAQIDAQIKRLQDEDRVRQDTIKVMQDRLTLADHTLLTDQQQATAAALYTTAIGDQTTKLAALQTQTVLESIARQNLIDAMNKQAASLTGGQSGGSTQPNSPGIDDLARMNAAVSSGHLADFLKFIHYPGYAMGTSYVPATGPYILHQGEAVIPASQNKQQTATHIEQRFFIDRVEVTDPTLGTQWLGL